jgi:hypothetical protein
MADDGLIQAYLRELAYSVRSLSDAEDIVTESADHLFEVRDELIGGGMTTSDAEATAIARFGSAELVARVCVTEARRTAAVPTRRTRQAGLAAMASVACLVAGQAGNVLVDDGGVHGAAVFVLTLAFPLFVLGLWGLRARHGGLGRAAPIALGLAVVSPALSLLAGWGAIVALVGLLAVAVGVFVVELLRASVLPVVPVVLLGAGPAGVVMALIASVAISAGGGDAGEVSTAVVGGPLALTAVGFTWLGWHLFQERAVDAPHRRLAAT